MTDAFASIKVKDELAKHLPPDNMEKFKRNDTTYNHPSKAVLELVYNKEKPEIWVNDFYQVEVRRNIPVPAISGEDGNPVTIAWLSIKRRDKKAILDWRHLQWIKNELVGEENEGVEIFPAESRLIDAANQFHLWVFEKSGFHLPFGFKDGRMVTENSIMGEVQRKFPKNRRPKDIDANEKVMREKIGKIEEQYNLQLQNENSKGTQGHDSPPDQV
jgi:hypothetical protein